MMSGRNGLGRRQKTKKEFEELRDEMALIEGEGLLVGPLPPRRVIDKKSNKLA